MGISSGPSSQNKDLLMFKLGMVTPARFYNAYITGVACSDHQPHITLLTGCDDDLNTVKSFVYNDSFIIECPLECADSAKTL